MKGSLTNEKDVRNVENAESNSSGRSYIKIGKGKNFLRLLKKDFVSEFVHVFSMGNKQFVQIVCLGGIEGGGYSPRDCPICERASKHWDRRKEIQASSNFSKSQKLKVEAKMEYEKGKALQTQQKTIMIAVRGDAVKVKERGKIKEIPEFEKEAKLINITTSQWKKLTKTIFEDYPFMKDTDDLINRNLCFVKADKSGKKNDKYTEVMIKPSKLKSKPPKVENELPDLDDVFSYTDEAEVKKTLYAYLKAQGEELEEDDGLDITNEKDDLDGYEESEGSDEGETIKKSGKKGSKNDEDEDTF